MPTYDRRTSHQPLKLKWKPDGPKKFYATTEMWQCRAVKLKASDTKWLAQINFSGSTFFPAAQNNEFDTPEEAMAACEEGCREILRKELANFT